MRRKSSTSAGNSSRSRPTTKDSTRQPRSAVSAAIPGDLLPRRARGVVPPTPGRACPGRGDLGTAGFFSVAMYYRGAADAHFVPLCPAVIRPQHWVAEGVGRQPGARRAVVTPRRVGCWESLPTASTSAAARWQSPRCSWPRWASWPRSPWSAHPLPETDLSDPQAIRKVRPLLAADPLTIGAHRPDPGPGDGQLGFTLDEMTGIAEKVLREMGLTSRFARLVIVLGHGSTSLNNPHESAYDCGACGGARGGPNARALAQMLNDRRIRERLSGRGLSIPPETVFVGGMHNTSSEAMTFSDEDLIPESHASEFEAARAILEQACDRNAHERCRRFQSAPLTLSYQGARQHVEGRAEDLAQVRPEWGTPRMPSRSSAVANGPAACSWTVVRSSPPTTPPRTIPRTRY